MTIQDEFANHSEEASENGAAQIYLKLADEAVRRGDKPQSAHLYLAAFDAAQADGTPSVDFVDGLRKAWKTAVELEDASLAEHVYGLLEPYSTEQDEEDHTQHIRSMTRNALKGFGIPTDEAHGIADILAGDAPAEGAMVKLSSKFPPIDFEELGLRPPQADEDSSDEEFSEERTGYADLVGYERAIQAMNERGVGLSENEAFTQFLEMMRERHGIDKAACTSTLLITADSPDDANLFMLATGVEYRVPAVRMRVEENAMGLPTLSIMLSKGIHNAQRVLQNGFEGPGVLLLENIDEWEVPEMHAPDGTPIPLFMQLTHGALQAVAFIRQAVFDPAVQVLTSATTGAPLQEFFEELLYPMEEFVIDLPVDSERAALWTYAAERHPSLADHDRDELISLTRGLARSEILHLAGQAVEAAYQEGIRKRAYVPVTRTALLEKIAEYLPLDSAEYAQVEDALAKNFSAQMDFLADEVESWRNE